MNNIINICPVCNHQNLGEQLQFCNNCNWELILIPENSSSPLKEYYNQKLKNHIKLYQINLTNTTIIQQLRQENNKLTGECEYYKEKIQYTSTLETQLSAADENIKNLSSQLSSYKAKFGDSWVSQNAFTKKHVNITWEILSNNAIRFYNESIVDLMPLKIVLLLKKSERPKADGDFDIAITIDTKERQLINNFTYELLIANKYILKGSYYLRFMNLNYAENNLFFFHKEQLISPNSFDFTKTKINI